MKNTLCQISIVIHKTDTLTEDIRFPVSSVRVSVSLIRFFSFY